MVIRIVKYEDKNREGWGVKWSLKKERLIDKEAL